MPGGVSGPRNPRPARACIFLNPERARKAWRGTPAPHPLVVVRVCRGLPDQGDTDERVWRLFALPESGRGQRAHGQEVLRARGVRILTAP